MAVVCRVVGGTSLGSMEAAIACRAFVTGLNKHCWFISEVSQIFTLTVTRNVISL